VPSGNIGGEAREETRGELEGGPLEGKEGGYRGRILYTIGAHIYTYIPLASLYI